jgi:hypothetical protein
MRPHTFPQVLLLCLALAGCAAAQATGDRSSGGDQWWNDGGPMTKEKASTICWMKYEKGLNDAGLDKRADLVNKCVADTMSGKPVQ